MRTFDQSLPVALQRAREAVMTRFRPILREHGLTEQQWRVIRALEGQEGLEITALSEKTLLLMPSLTRILKGMEDQGWVERRSVAGDNRRRSIRLAAKGIELFETVSPKSEAAYRAIESKMGAGELAGLLAGLQDLAKMDSA